MVLFLIRQAARRNWRRVVVAATEREMVLEQVDPKWRRRGLIGLGVAFVLFVIYLARESGNAMGVFKKPAEIAPGSAMEAAARQSIPFFLHFHKAGGTFACNLAAKTYPLAPEQVEGGCSILGDAPETYSQGHAGWANREWTCGERLDHISNHGVKFLFVEKPLGASSWCPGMFRYMTIFRHPISRIESSVRSHKQSPETAVSWLDSTVAPATRDALLYEGTGAVDNHYIRVLLGMEGFDVPAGMITEAHLDQAKEKLARFGLVMTLEDIIRDREQFFTLAGWNRPVEGGAGLMEVKARVGEGRKSVFTAEQRARLERANALDLRLYEFARERARMLTAKAETLNAQRNKRKSKKGPLR